MSKSSELDRKAKLYILKAVSDQAETDKVLEIVAYIKNRFESEYGWRVAQVGRQSAMIDWLQGLALHIEYRNHKIIELAVQWGSLDENATERAENKILVNYWSFMAAKVLQLIDGYRVPKSEAIE